MFKNFQKTKTFWIMLGSIFLAGGIVLGLYLQSIDTKVNSATTPIVVVNTDTLSQFATDGSTTSSSETSTSDNPALVLVPVAADPPVIAVSDPSLPAGPYADCGKNVVNDEITTLACNMYHEARGETALGQLLVGLVTIARVKSDKFPNSIHEVVYQSKMSGGVEVAQFNWTLDSLPDTANNYASWTRAMNLARLVYEVYNKKLKMSINFGTDANPVYVDWDKIMFYHTVRPQRPAWTAGLTVLGNIGNHTFYSY